jgi:hypothetical protein
MLGIISDILQAPPILRKLFISAVNMHAYLFVFAVWELLLLLGYLILFRADYAPDSTMAIGFYKIFINSMVCGGISMMVLSSIRFWYWDGVN